MSFLAVQTGLYQPSVSPVGTHSIQTGLNGCNVWKHTPGELRYVAVFIQVVKLRMLTMLMHVFALNPISLLPPELLLHPCSSFFTAVFSSCKPSSLTTCAPRAPHLPLFAFKGKKSSVRGCVWFLLMPEGPRVASRRFHRPSCQRLGAATTLFITCGSPKKLISKNDENNTGVFCNFVVTFFNLWW